MTTSVPFIDLSRIHRPLLPQFHARLEQIVSDSSFVLGSDVGQFEQAFASYIQTSACVGVASGLDALKLALLALGIGPGDEVIVPANTFIATAFAVSSTGATPVFVDVDSQTYNLDPRLTEQALSHKTKAILPVHLYGQAAAMTALYKLASDHKIAIVEDCAQAHGATHASKKCGSLGTMGCFSFYPTKNLGALGDGGAITTNDPALAERIRTLRNVGQKEKNEHTVIGTNSRLDSLQAAFLHLKLKELDQHNASRKEAAQLYHQGLSSLPQLELPVVGPHNTHVYHLFVVQTQSHPERESLKRYLTERKIGVAIHYPTPIPFQECYRHLSHQLGQFPVTEHLSATMLSLPMFAGMTSAEVEYVCQAIQTFYKSGQRKGAA